MFIIRDCNGAIVGRLKGYKRHHTCEALISRPCAIRRAIYNAFYSVDRQSKSNLVYSIKWED